MSDLRKIVKQGTEDIIKTLYLQASEEAERLPKLRGCLLKLENRILSQLDSLSPLQQLKLYGIMRNVADNSTAFLERMFKLTAQSVDLAGRIDEFSQEAPSTNQLMDKDSRKIQSIVENILDGRLRESNR